MQSVVHVQKHGDDGDQRTWRFATNTSDDVDQNVGLAQAHDDAHDQHVGMCGHVTILTMLTGAKACADKNDNDAQRKVRVQTCADA